MIFAKLKLMRFHAYQYVTRIHTYVLLLSNRINMLQENALKDINLLPYHVLRKRIYEGF